MLLLCDVSKREVSTQPKLTVLPHAYRLLVCWYVVGMWLLFSIAITSSRRLLVSQLCRNASVAGVVYNDAVLSPNLLQCEEQGAFIDLRESEEDVYRVFARASSSTFDWLLELIKMYNNQATRCVYLVNIILRTSDA